MFSFFKIKPILFEAKIILSRHSYVEVVRKGDEITDKDFILFGLLIYARLLRLFRLKKIDPKTAPYTFFLEALKTQSNFPSDSEFVNKVKDTIEIMKNSYEKETTLKVIYKGDSNSNKTIYTGIPFSQELGCYVYTVYSFIWYHISEQNRLVLFQLFAALSRLKVTKEITANDVTNFPNIVINEVNIA